MFLNGADGQTPELRAPSIKGALRFWWRALNGHLPLTDIAHSKGLKSLESEIFGGSGDNVQRSRVIITVSQDGPLSKDQQKLVPHKGEGIKAEAFVVETMFDVTLKIKDNPHLNKEKAIALFMLTCYLGGFGKRVRRGMGSVDIIAIDGQKDGIPENIDLNFIYGLISKISPFCYRIKNDKKIVFTFSRDASPAYGYVVSIQIGGAYRGNEKLLRKISDTTHELKKYHGASYDAYMGHANGGQRYASPVYTSVIRGCRPIITTLNLRPNSKKDTGSLDIQEEFKNKILFPGEIHKNYE